MTSGTSMVSDETTADAGRLPRVALILNVATLVVGVANGAASEPWRHLWSIVSIALPWVAVALVARFKPVYRFGEERIGRQGDLSFLLLVPGIGLSLGWVRDFEPLSWKPAVLLAAVLAAALTFAATRAQRDLSKGTIYILAVAAFAYGFCTGMLLDAGLDHSTPQIYPVTVLGKFVSRGRGKSWNLNVSPWGSRTGANRVPVSPARYWATRPGDTVCVYLKSGALGVAWYTAGSCKQ